MFVTTFTLMSGNANIYQKGKVMSETERLERLRTMLDESEPYPKEITVINPSRISITYHLNEIVLMKAFLEIAGIRKHVIMPAARKLGYEHGQNPRINEISDLV